MKTKIPDSLKDGLPHNSWGKLLGVTPVVMTVIATLLAGLASSEMTRAQYDRALAAQQQSKAGDQWSFFQAKRLRSSLQRNTLDLLQATTVVSPVTMDQLGQRLAGTPLQVASETRTGQLALAALESSQVPFVVTTPKITPELAASLAAVDAGATDAEIWVHLANVADAELAAALRSARAQARALDDTLAPINGTIDQIEKQALAARTNDESTAFARDFTFARIGYSARRYDLEARLNQSVAQILELQVRRSNASAERHHARSQRFFYGMLAAQLGVIISTLAMAARQRSLLWAIAAGAGLIAIAFAVYVYLYV